MNKKGDAVVLETMNLFQVIGGFLFFLVMVFALNQVFGAESKGYALSVSEQLNLGKTLIKNADGDASIAYIVGNGVKITGDDVDLERTNTKIINNLGSKKLIIEKKGGRFIIYEKTDLE
ncbi:hypothetical protein HY498_02950 [Candidatus Woesearchaeota archaeon]|nr:hypothetical protein [Candidatus Woesearchaeota archaeon]